MSLITEIRALLGRPLALPPNDRPVRGAKRNAPAAPLGTEQHYVEVLEESRAKRAEARELIATAGDERENLLTSGASFEAVKALNEKIDEALFTIDQLERAEPELLQNLSEIRYHKVCARWIEVRDEVAAIAEGHIAAIATYQRTLDSWRESYNRVVEEFPDATAILPQLPALYHGNTTFEAQIERLKVVERQRAGPSLPTHLVLSDAIEATRKMGFVPELVPPAFRYECERALQSDVTIELTSQSVDSEGRTLSKGTRMTVAPEEAADFVQRGRALYA